MARKSDSTPHQEPGHAAAILPGVPLPDWALTGEPFLPEIDIPAVVDPSMAPESVARNVNLDDLSIAEMELALRELSESMKATPVGAQNSNADVGVQGLDASTIVAPPTQPVAPVPSATAYFGDIDAMTRVEPWDSATFAVADDDGDDADETAPPIEFAVPGYPESPSAPQIPLPVERPGYPADFAHGLPAIPPPPPPARTLDIAPPPPAAAVPVVYNEPVRVDLPMSAVLAREFTRQTPWETGHTHVQTAPVSDPAPVPQALIPSPVTPELPSPLDDSTGPIPVVPIAVAAAATIPAIPAIDNFASAPSVLPEVFDAPEHVDPVTPKTSSRRLLTLIALGGLLALIAGAVAFFLPGILNPTDTSEPVATASPSPTSPSASSPTTIATAGFVLQTPTTIGTLTKMSGAIDSSLHAATTSSVIPGLTSAVSGVYGTGQVPQATVIAWHAATPPAATSVSQAFAGFQSSAKTAVTNVSGVSSTGLPGQMSCGETQINGTATTLCFWADPATFGSITVVAPKTPAEGALLAAQIRSAVEVQQ